MYNLHFEDWSAWMSAHIEMECKFEYKLQNAAYTILLSAN